MRHLLPFKIPNFS